MQGSCRAAGGSRSMTGARGRGGWMLVKYEESDDGVEVEVEFGIDSSSADPVTGNRAQGSR